MALTVTDEGAQTGTDGRVQEGVLDVDAGGTLHVDPGTFTEQVVIDAKNVTVDGSGSGATTIVSPDAVLTPFFAPLGTRRAPIILAKDAANVIVQDVTVDGDAQGDCDSNKNYTFIGVAFWNAGGALRDSRVTAVREPYDTSPGNPAGTHSGCQNGIGVWSRNDSGLPRTLTVDGNTIDDVQKNATALRGPDLGLTVSDNTVVGGGDQKIIAQNGIQASGTSVPATVTGNTVRDYRCMNLGAQCNNADGVLSAAMLLFDLPTGTQIDGNTISGSDMGLYLENSSGTTATGNTLRNNKFFGAYLFDGTSTLVSNVVRSPGATGIIVASYGGFSTSDTEAVLRGNNVSGNATGIRVEDGGPPDSFTAKLGPASEMNRIVGNGVGIDNRTAAPVAAENNWWGCNPGVGNDRCDATQGDVDSSPHLVLRATSAAGSFDAPGSTAVAADLTRNSAGALVGTLFPDGVPAGFETSIGDVLSLGGTTVGALSGTTLSSASDVGSAVFAATVDHQTAYKTIQIAPLPAGPPGPGGPPGTTGGVGPAGPTGQTGATGDPGAAGAKGDTGPTGPQGLKGDTGTAGAGAAGGVGSSSVDGDPVLIETKTVKPDKLGVVRVAIRCPRKAGLCDGSIALRTIAKFPVGTRTIRLTLGKTRFTLKGGERRLVAVQITAIGRRLLERSRSIAVAATTTSRNRTGVAAQSSRSILIRQGVRSIAATGATLPKA